MVSYFEQGKDVSEGFFTITQHREILMIWIYVFSCFVLSQQLVSPSFYGSIMVYSRK